MPVTTPHPLHVEVASAHSFPSTQRYQQLSYRIGDFFGQADFHIIPLTRYDLILGAGWFASLGAVTVDLQLQTLTFSHDGTQHIFSSIDSRQDYQLISGKQFIRSLPKAHCAAILSVQPVQPIADAPPLPQVWYNNVPHTRLVADKGGQNWIAIAKDKFKFPGGGTQFAHGADQYLDQMSQMLPDLKFGTHVRVALDIGCGVASWGAYLLARGVLTLSIAPKDVHENQIQFALERGIPAMIAVLATHRLLYPSQAFDLIHCSRCRIEWTRDDGVLLLEVDRVLKAGGYFAWAAQPVYKHEESNQRTWLDMEDLATRMCWKLVAKQGYIAIWQKPIDKSCYSNRLPGALPTLCDINEDPDSVWYVTLKACITLPRNNPDKFFWLDYPARLDNPPVRLQSLHIDAIASKNEVFEADRRYWIEIVQGYLRGLSLKIEDIRNVMDMRACYGGFAAALADQKVDWWVMNVVPISGINTLPIIYDRGLIGVAHDWCEPFDTYPRTYDLLHVHGLFTLEQDRCNIAHIILEMDRILRPGGWVLIRESMAMALSVEVLAKSVRWKTHLLDTENGPFGKDKLLSCQKVPWHGF
ncbi:hypothetical protein O6H91_22G069400 [Diphasiastrum complanatum]|uniref:Uncharacterized protein n=1 Tax=Diphasiastrum complanatum TaxID=34168 RepID=A0ACC2AGQ0_DIPCM|nr:hypothetical protein O6H91_22G069400 [Diphasiastrum complanatum]